MKRRAIHRIEIRLPTSKALVLLKEAIKAAGPSHRNWTHPNGLIEEHAFVLDQGDTAQRAVLRLLFRIARLIDLGGRWTPPWPTTGP